MGVPDNEHGVVASIGSHDPVLVVTAQDRGDLVAMTLKQLLLFGHIVVDDTSMGSRVENLGSLFVSKEMDSLVNVLVESINFSEGLYREKRHTNQSKQETFSSVTKRTRQN